MLWCSKMTSTNLLEQAVGNEYLVEIEEKIAQPESEKQADVNAIVSVFSDADACNSEL